MRHLLLGWRRSPTERIARDVPELTLDEVLIRLTGRDSNQRFRRRLSATLRDSAGMR